MKVIKAIISICKGAEKFNAWIERENEMLKKVSALFIIQGIVYCIAEAYGYMKLLDTVEDIVSVAVIIIYNLYIKFMVYDVDVELVEEGEDHGSNSSSDSSVLGQWLELPAPTES